MRFIVAILVLGVLLAGCGSAPATGEQACSPAERDPFVASVGTITTRWNDVITTAAASDGSALQSSVDEMQQLRDQVAGLSTPACAAETRTALVTYMDTSINAYLAELAGKPAAEVDRLLKQAEEQFAAFQNSLVALSGKGLR